MLTSRRFWLALWRITKKAKAKISTFLGQPKVARWGAPIRVIMRAIGLHPPPVSLENAKQILVIRPDGIGDVVLTSPFLRELRRAAPSARITLLVKAACFPLVEYCPHVDAIHRLPHRGGVRLVCAAWRLRLGPLPWRGFDLVLLPRHDIDWYNSELLGHLLAGKGAVVGQHGRAQVERLRIARLLHLETHIGPNIEHEALMPLRLLDWLGTSACHDPRLELWLAATDRKYADELLAVGEPLVAMATGASHPSRCWPIARFAALAEWLSHEYHASVILLGAPGDPEFSAALNLVGRTTLRQAAALIERCDLFIGNDSGLMHVAAAAKISVVEISGFPRHGSPSHPNSPERFGPWGVPHRILRPPSGTADLCVSAIAVDEVRSACSALLSRRSVRRRPNALDKLLDAR